MSEVLHTKYRPQQWDDVVGQQSAVRAMSAMVGRRDSHAFLLIGPSGVGKTTIARIASAELGCSNDNLIEIDGATFTGIDDMRRVQESIRYAPFGAQKARCVIVDEAHRLSGNAWDSLLKVVEEPPPHVFWFFCTTQHEKVPTTIKTRCTTVVLRELEERELGDLYDDVCDDEDINLPGDVGDMIIREAYGSPRKLLTNLALCREAKDKKEAASILRSATSSEDAIELCRFIAAGKLSGSWQRVMALVGKIDANPESVRILVQNYMAKACMDAKTDQAACFFLQIMEAFAEPYNASEGTAPLLRSLGRIIYSD